MDSKTKMAVLKPQSDWVFTSCPALVTPETWDECNRILDVQSKSRKKPGPRAVHLLSGFVQCTCGKKMYVYHENLVYSCKACKNRIPVSDIDEIYHEQLKTFLLTETDVETYLSTSHLAISGKEELIKTLANEAVKLKGNMDKLVKLRMNDELTKEAFMAYYKPDEERYTQIQNQLPELQAEIDFLKIQYLSSDTVLQEARNLYERWPVIPTEEKRSIVEVITEHITIGREDISIKLSYIPTIPIIQNAGKSERNYSAT
jgi:site-specific DNA recombinase